MLVASEAHSARLRHSTRASLVLCAEDRAARGVNEIPSGSSSTA